MKGFFTKAFSAVLITLMCSQVSMAALVLGSRDDLLQSSIVTNNFTDVEIPNLEDYSTEEYYQNLGALVLSVMSFATQIQGLVGYEAADGSRYFSPNNTLTRAEAVKFFNNFRAEVGSGGIPNEVCFTDYNNYSESWWKDYACYLKHDGIISGYADGTFRPNNTLNGAEIAKFVSNTYGLPTVNESAYNHWYDGYIENLQEFNIAPEGIDPTHSVTRGEMASYILRGAVVEHFGSTEAFTPRLLTRFFEEMGSSTSSLIFFTHNETGSFYPYNYIYHPEDFSAVSFINDGENESLTLKNHGSSSLDVSGYYVTFLDASDSGDYEATDVSFTFPEGSTVGAGESVTINGILGGEFAFENPEGPYGDGFLNDHFGDYLYLIYNADAQLIDVVVFQVES
ncbi:S-layer homology domain-containing protein [Candidatus Peregrinibacteria bacterium]|nr:MAG: S-layer homology domain-containing protein [Candidatus Peregrinibacteria bacterium]